MALLLALVTRGERVIEVRATPSPRWFEPVLSDFLGVAEEAGAGLVVVLRVLVVPSLWNPEQQYDCSAATFSITKPKVGRAKTRRTLAYPFAREMATALGWLRSSWREIMWSVLEGDVGGKSSATTHRGCRHVLSGRCVWSSCESSGGDP